MSEIGKNVDLDEVLKGTKRVFVLFYASWCPFSRMFLPIFQRCSKKTPESCVHIMMDDKDALCEEYAIEIFPTVILFENGKVSRRLDGIPGAGISELQLKELLGID